MMLVQVRGLNPTASDCSVLVDFANSSNADGWDTHTSSNWCCEGAGGVTCQMIDHNHRVVALDVSDKEITGVYISHSWFPPLLHHTGQFPWSFSNLNQLLSLKATEFLEVFRPWEL